MSWRAAKILAHSRGVRWRSGDARGPAADLRQAHDLPGMYWGADPPVMRQAQPSRTSPSAEETSSLRRRLGGNYRSPGPRQQTTQRIHGLLRKHLAAWGVVRLAVATRVGRILAMAQHPST